METVIRFVGDLDAHRSALVLVTGNTRHFAWVIGIEDRRVP